MVAMSKIKAEDQDPGLVAAIEAAGGLRALARALGMAYQPIQEWRRVPAHRIIKIEAVTGIPREKLRPDLYRKPER
jgi:DNA-binding transcriptional regulator YdaS (Cro superfamily)